jgi:hypothetical protein
VAHHVPAHTQLLLPANLQAPAECRASQVQKEKAEWLPSNSDARFLLRNLEDDFDSFVSQQSLRNLNSQENRIIKTSGFHAPAVRHNLVVTICVSCVRCVRELVRLEVHFGLESAESRGVLA